jgi:hypothetical protein
MDKKEVESQADGRQWRKERRRQQSNNQSRWTMRCSSKTTGRGAGRLEVVV